MWMPSNDALFRFTKSSSSMGSFTLMMSLMVDCHHGGLSSSPSSLWRARSHARIRGRIDGPDLYVGEAHLGRGSVHIEKPTDVAVVAP